MLIGPLLLLLGCDSLKPSEGKPASDNAAAPADKKEAKDDDEALPAETMTLALDEGESKIPAVIDVPKGSTTFNDTPTKIRVNYGKAGKAFGVQIAEGNEFNTNLDEIEKGMLENKYGMTNKSLEKTDTLYRWSMTSERGDTNNKFQMLIEIDGKTWVCKDGNYGGWTEEQSKRQIEACKTLRAKP